MVNITLVTYINSRISMHLHAQSAGEFITTGWLDIIRNILTKRNISEFDFTLFHDKITYISLRKAILHFDIPSDWRAILFKFRWGFPHNEVHELWKTEKPLEPTTKCGCGSRYCNLRSAVPKGRHNWIINSIPFKYFE